MPNPAQPATSFPEFLQSFGVWLDMQGGTAKTNRNYLSDVRVFARWLEEEQRISSPRRLDDIHLQAYLAFLLEGGVPQATINRKLSSLRRLAEFAQTTRSLPHFRVPLNPTSPTQAEVARDRVLHRFTQALEREGCQSTTVINYLGDIRNFLDLAPQETLPNLFLKPKIANYQAGLRQQGLSPATITRKIASLKRFASWATEQEYLSINPFLTPFDKLAANVREQLRPLAFLEGSKVRPESASRLAGTTQVPPSREGGQQGTTRKALPQQIYQAYSNWRLSSYLHLAVLLIFCVILGLFGYQQFFRDAAQKYAFPSAPTRPSRILSFQGRLTDSASNPITTSITFEFRLFSASSGGTELWDSTDAGGCSIDPDQDGVFSTLLGTTSGGCGNEISENVFSENQEVWLEVKVGSQTLTPRQRIATVPYALNAETLQGFPPSLSGTINTIPVINALGEIIIGASNPSLIASSGAFLVQAESFNFRTEAGTAGDIIFNPDAGGTVQINSGTTTEDSLYVSNSNLTSGNLIHGYVGNESGTGNLLYLGGGSTETTRLSVSKMGDLFVGRAATVSGTLNVNGSGTHNVAGTLNLTGTTLTSSGALTLTPGGALTLGATGQNTTLQGAITTITSNGAGNDIFLTSADDITFDDNQLTSAIKLSETATGFTSGDTGIVDAINTAYSTAANAGRWDITLGALHPKNITTDLLVGGTATTSAKFALKNVLTGTPTASISGSTANVATYITGNGNLSTTNMAALTLGSATTGSILLSPGGNSFATFTQDGVFTLDSLNFDGTTIGLTTDTDLLSLASNALTVNGSVTITGLLDANGQVDLGDGGDTIALSGTTINLTSNGAGNDIFLTSADDITFDDAQLTSAITLTDTDTSFSSGDTGIVDAINTAYITALTSSSQWQITLGALHPKNTTTDFLVGGTSTASAKFAVLNVNSGTPVASVAGNITLASDSNQTRTIGATRMNNLQIGDSQTGSLIFSPAGSTALTIGQNGLLTLKNAATIDNTSNGTLAFTEPTLQLIGSTAIDIDSPLLDLSTQTFDVTLNNAVDALNFDSDTLSIDATNNRVGIGDAAPDVKFEVLSTTEQLRLTHTEDTNDARFTVNGSGNLTINVSGTQTTFSDNVLINGDATIGDSSADVVTSNADEWTFASDTEFILSGGVNGLYFDGTTFSVDATNNRIGLGTAAPRARLDIQESGAGDFTSLILGKTDATWGIGDYSAIDWRGDGSPVLARIAVEPDASGDFNMDFFTTTDGGSNLVNRMRITDDGRIGIGTTGPDAILESLSTSAEQLRLTYTDNSVYTTFTTDSSGNLTINPTGTYMGIADDLRVNGGDIGIDADTDLLQLANGILTVNGTINAAGGLVTRSGGNLNISTTTSGDLSLISAGEMYFDDTRTSAIPLSLTDTDLNVFAAGDRAIIDALNYLYNNLGTGGGVGASLWNKTADNVVYLPDTTQSVFIGGTATTSAKFAFNAITGNAIMKGYLDAPGATFSASIAGNVPLTIMAHGSQTANLTNWKNSAGTVLTAIGPTGNLLFGSAGDVELLRGAADRLDLATGDSLNLVSGNISIGGTTVVSSGRLLFGADGSETAPAFSFSADTNTGMYRAASDTLAFATGGTQRMYVDSVGNVSIGANPSSASARLQVVAAGTAQTLIGQADNNVGAIGFASTLTNTNFSLAGDGTDTYINAPDSTNGDIYFQINGSSQMRLDKDGFLGIGSGSDPAFQLSLPAGSGIPASGIGFGTDTNLYRLSAAKLKTDTQLTVGTKLGVGTDTLGSNLEFEVVGDAYINGGQLRLGNIASDPTAIGAGSMYYNTTTGKISFWDGLAWNELAGGSGGDDWDLSTVLGVLYPKNPNPDLLIGGSSTASAKFRVNSGTGTISIGSIAHAISDQSGNLAIDSQGTFVQVNPDLKIAGGEILGPSGEARISLSDSQDKTIISTRLDVDGFADVYRGATLSAIAVGDKPLAIRSASASSIWYVDSAGKFVSNKGIAGGTAWIFDTSSTLTYADANLFEIKNNGSTYLALDNDGNLRVTGNIISEKGFAITMKNIGPALSQYDLVVVNTTENSDGVPRMSATDSAYAKLGFGVVQETCALNATCEVVIEGNTQVNVADSTNKGDYLFSSGTLGKATSGVKQFDGLIGIASSDDSSDPYTVRMVMMHQPAVSKLRLADKNRMHNDYREAAWDYTMSDETNRYNVDENIRKGLYFDTFDDSLKTDSAYLSVAMDNNKNKAGLWGGVTMNATNTDTEGSTYLGAADANDVYFYDRSQTGTLNRNQDSKPQTLVELGIDPNWYNGVTLDASPSANMSSNPSTNLSLSYNGSLIKATGRYAAGEEDGPIVITIRSDNEATSAGQPTVTFDWRTGYGGTAAHSGSSVTASKGEAYTLETGTSDITVTFTDTEYHAGDRFRIASWYIEPVTANDRGEKQYFPLRSYVVAHDSGIDIIDADTNKLWMRACAGASCSLGSVGITSIHALNGTIYGGSSLALRTLNFVRDGVEKYDNGGWSLRAPVANRSSNTAATFNNAGLTTVDAVINDVQTSVVCTGNSTDGGDTRAGFCVTPKLYTALATDTGVSVIHQTGTNVIYDYSDVAADDYNNVWITSGGEVYALNETQVQLEKWNNVHADTADELAGTPDKIWDDTATNIPAIAATTVTLNTAGPDSLVVTEATSTIDNTSDTIYITTNQGMSSIQDKAGDESNGSVKYYTNSYITENQIGDIRGAWNFTEASGSLADSAVTANFLEDENAPTYSVSGVRGVGLTFDGSADHLCSDTNNDGTCDTDTSFDFGTGSFAISTWFKHSTTIVGTDTIIDHYYNTTPAAVLGWRISMNSTGHLSFGIDDDNASFPEDAATSTNNYNDNVWHHVVAVKEGTSAIRLYVDGLEVGSDTSLSATGTLTGTGAILGVGSDCSVGAACATGSNFWTGQLDELSLTAESLTPAQIKRMYENGKRAVEGSHGINDFKNNLDENGNGAGATNTLQAVGVQMTSAATGFGPYAWTASNNTSNADDGYINKIDLGSDTVVQYMQTTTDPSIPDNDATSLSVSPTGLEIVGMDGIGAVSPGQNAHGNNTTGTYYSDTISLPDNINHAYMWYNQWVDSDCVGCSLIAYASNDGGTNYTSGVILGTDNNQTLPEKELLFNFPSPGNSLKLKIEFARDADKDANIYLQQYGIAWFNDDDLIGGGVGGGLFSDSDTAVADGSYIEVTHNQNTYDLLSSGWIYNETTGAWDSLDAGAELAGEEFGTGDDGELFTTGTFNLNTSMSGSRTVPDGVAYKVASNPTGTTIVTSDTPNGLAAGDEIILINMQGASGNTTDVGNYEFLRVSSVNTGTKTITVGSTIQNSYDGSSFAAQDVVIQRVPNYTFVTVNSGNTLTASAWDGLTSHSGQYYTGMVLFRASEGLTNDGTISANGLGYSGGTGGTGASGTNTGGSAGESFDGVNGIGGTRNIGGETCGGGRSADGATASPNNGCARGGGGGGGTDGTTNATNDGGGGGGGGGYGGGGGGGSAGGNSATSPTGGAGGTTGTNAGGGGGSSANGGSVGAGGAAGSAGTAGNNGTGGQAGSGSTGGSGGGGSNATGQAGAGGGGGGTYGDVNLADLFLGSGGAGGAGASGSAPDNDAGKAGGAGGGIIFIAAQVLSSNGTLSSNGSDGTAATRDGGGGGSGSGGSIYLMVETASLTGTTTASGGSAIAGAAQGGGAGGGGVGRIHADYVNAISGTTTPTIDTDAFTPSGSILSSGNFLITQVDANTVRLYNYSGTTQNLRLDVATTAGGSTNSDSCPGCVSLAPLSADIDSDSGTNSIWINKTNESGRLIRLQNDAVDRFTVGWDGHATVSGNLTVSRLENAVSNLNLKVGGTNAGVSGNANVMFRDASNTLRARFDMATTTGGNSYGTLYLGATNTANADVAEHYPSLDTLQPGEVVTFDRSNNTHVKRSTSAYDKALAGIISTAPGIILGQGDPNLLDPNAAKTYPVALTGRIPVNIASGSASIQIGDYLTSSNVPGMAQKALQAGHTVARALEPWTPESGKTQIMAFAQLSYYDPTWSTGENVTIADIKAGSNEPLSRFAVNENGELVGLGEMALALEENLNTLDASQSAALADKSLLENTLEQLEQLGSTVVGSLDAARARVLGTLFAGRVETPELAADLIRPLTGADMVVQLGGDEDSGSGRFVVMGKDGQQLAAIDGAGRLTANELAAQLMEARFLGADELQVINATVSGELTADSARLRTIESQLAQVDELRGGNATLSGTLFAENIEGNIQSRSITDFEQRVRDLVARERAETASASSSALLAENNEYIQTLALLQEWDTWRTSGGTTGSTGNNQETDDFGTITGGSENSENTGGDSNPLLIAQDLQIDGVLNTTALNVENVLTVGQTLLAGNSFSFAIAPECLDESCATFNFQPSGQGTLNFLASTMIITADGGVEVNGDLKVAGDAKVGGSLFASLLKPQENSNIEVQLANTTENTTEGQADNPFLSELVIRGQNNTEVAAFSASGSARFQQLIVAAQEAAPDQNTQNVSISTDATTGTATLQAGQTEFTIRANKVTGNSLIYLTPTSSTGNKVLFIKNKQADNPNTPENEAQFVVALDGAADQNVSFNWWVIN